MEAEEGECSGQCEDISTSAGADFCQDCLEENIDPSCQDVSGADCWYCGGAIVEKWRQCAVSLQNTTTGLTTTQEPTTVSISVGGTITSKNHPSIYDNNYDEEWTLEAPEEHIIQLTFESFDIEYSSSCPYDWVEVSYGSYSEKFCGSSIPGPFNSTGPTMTVKMHTDSSVTGTGFRAVWTSFDPNEAASAAAAAAAVAAAAAAAAMDTINCISQAIVPSCSECVCTLLCYWSPTEDLCTSCLDQPQLASLFLHHQQCPQGWVYSEESSSCVKAYNQMKPWKFAKSFCENGGGILAQPKSTSTIQDVLEAVNLLGEGGLHWLGGQQSGEEFLWVGDNSVVDSSNWAQGFPVPG